MTVLVLEDEAGVRKMLCAILKAKGHAVLEAATVGEIVEGGFPVNTHIDVLVADVGLPDGSGIHAALALRPRVPGLRVLLTSGYPPSLWNDQDRADLGELPSDVVTTLLKPFSPADLIRAVQELVLPAHRRTATGG